MTHLIGNNCHDFVSFLFTPHNYLASTSHKEIQLRGRL